MNKDLVVDEKGNVLNVNNIELFTDSEFGELEIVEADGKFLFPATDCAVKLGYSNPWKAIGDHCRSLTKREVPHPQSSSKTIEKNYIPEGDLYRLIVHSKLPSAKKFESWVFDEVLPSIRKHGAYMTQDTLNKAIGDPDFAIGLLTALKEEREKVKQLNSEIEENRPATLTGKAVESSANGILVGQYVPILREAGWEIGSGRLFNELRSDGFLCCQKGRLWNKPTQHALESGLMKYRTTVYTNSKNEQQVGYTPLITGKGQLYFLDFYKKKYGF